ncbi:MAG: iron-sulfur cluster biosynthesis family protein [Gaiellaceae bacterium]
MLALTENAVSAVKTIVSSSEGTPETGGLRVVADTTGPQVNFQMNVAAVPAEDDEVVEEQGARLFLDPEASTLLGDKLLDAAVDQNTVQFSLAEQAA